MDGEVGPAPRAAAADPVLRPSQVHGLSTTVMSVTGWRVHFTHRDLTWPREETPFIRGFSALSAGLDLRLDDLGVPDGQPFLIRPAGRYDVTLNRYFSVGRWVGGSV
ncbi:hypothetical protein [Streptomyces mirabilis]|uniref:hypothetical protein n=1 Tax=Streptomyces mirabilis TaxID=68239 RepID=UPI0036D89C86